MDADLIELITRKVMEVLGEGAGDSLPEKPSDPPVFEMPQSLPGKRVLLLVDRSSTDEEAAFEQIRKLGESGIMWSVLHTEESDIEKTRKRLAGSYSVFVSGLPKNADEFVRSFDGILIPFLSLAACSKSALLIEDHLVPAVIFSALREEKPILAGADILNSFNLYSSMLPKTFLDVLRAHRAAVEGFGVVLAEARTFSSAFREFFGGKMPVHNRTKPVVTQEDIIVSNRSGTRILEFPRGTIVTPLAWETAGSLGLEIRIL
jgi:hypothetical protein